MNVDIYQVDAFIGEGCFGNAAGVCLPPTSFADERMQAIATEMNLAETTFVFPDDKGLRIRWFTPTVEVDLCGHATLAAAWVLANMKGEPGPWTFQSRSGPLGVSVEDEFVVLDFPAQQLEARATPEAVVRGLGVPVESCYKAKVPSGNWLVRVADEQTLRELWPDMGELASLPEGGVIVTAAGEECDFVSRFFAPLYGIDEDAVTGSAHCALAPYWGERLGKTSMSARQLSERGGELRCEWRGERVAIAGRASLDGIRHIE